MSLYDIVMIIIFLGSIWFGFWKGLSWQIASLASIFLSYFVAVTFPDAIAQYISAEPPFNRFAAMLILFIGTSLVVWTIFGSISKSIKKMELKGFDRQAGAILGAFKGAVLCMVVTMFAVSLLGESARDSIHRSKTGFYVVRGIDELSGIAPNELAQFIHPYIEDFRENIVAPDGSLPPQNPIFNNQNGEQQVNDNQFNSNGHQNNYGTGTFQDPTTQQPGQGGYQQGSWGTPASPAGYQTPVQQPGSQNGGYNSGTFNGGGNWQYPNQGGYQQPPAQNNAPASNQGRWNPPAQPPSQPNTDNGGWADQFPTITRGENGWRDVNVNINSKDILQRGTDAAIDAGKQWLEGQRRQ